MTKILFLQEYLFEFIGPMQLSAMLKSKGHETDLLVWQKEKDIISSIKKINPDVIAFSVSTGYHKLALEKARYIKSRLNIPCIFGGPHPTFFPDFINEPEVDMICIGEGDIAFLELADKIQKKQDITNIKNLWVRKDGKIYKNEIRPLIEDLDSLPFIDRELYYKRYPFLRDLSVKKFMLGRGCPYNCTFCFNKSMKELYKDKGRYVRKRSPENIIKEMKYVKEKYSLKSVRISDDTFTTNHEWLKNLLELYKREIKLPFTALCRVNELDEPIIKELADAGCKVMFFGIESGDEGIRNNILNKNISDEQIITAASLLRKYNIKFGTYNMFGLPDETVEKALKTVKINAKIKPDYPYSTVFQPYPATQIVDFAKKSGQLPADFSIDDVGSMTSRNVLNLKEKDQIANLQRFFYLCVRFPFIIPVVKKLIKLPPNFIFKMIYNITAGWTRMKAFGANLKEGLRLAWELRSNA